MKVLEGVTSDSKAARAASRAEAANAIAVNDVRDRVARATARAPRKPHEVRRFLESRRRLIGQRPGGRPEELRRAASELDRLLGAGPGNGPTPGGVGYGVIYDNDFRAGFGTGTALTVNYVCPDQPGGNVSDFLYLTATNRSARGVEALMQYHAQGPVGFRVYDRARPGQEWQADLGHDALTDYLYPVSVGGRTYQNITVNNLTYQVNGAGTWRNDVLLYNHSRRAYYDLVYRFEYPSTRAEQKAAAVGWWGPIVETFQDSYANTKPLGFIWAQLLTRTTEVGDWTVLLGWEDLTASNSSVRADNKGFVVIYQEPDTDLIVEEKPS